MNAFLTQIAEHYYKNYNNQIAQFGFVFPNRRAGLFFRKELAKQAKEPIFAPDIMGINDLLYSYSNLKPADHTTLLFILYKEYKRIMASDEQFDHFICFGNMLLSDFNEIDKYLVDASQLFQNISDLNQISTVFDYLEPEQIKVIERFWGHFIPTHDKILKVQYLNLWTNLYQLYHDFQQTLRNNNMGYDGMIFKESALKMQLKENLSCKYQRLVFIGFNALNPTEKAVFNYFKYRQLADFYFDYDMDWITCQPQSAALFTADNLKNYKSEFKLQAANNNQPQIDVIAVPSQIGQTKQIYQILKEETENNKQENIPTAVILPDESLLTPMLHAIPPKIKAINITMGYPLSLTPMAALLQHIANLQGELRETITGTHFYYKPVLAILNHPYVFNSNEKEIAALQKELINNNYFSIPAEKLAITPLLQCIFKPQHDISQTINYVGQVIDAIHTQLLITQTSPLDNEFFFSYRSAFNRLCDNLAHFNIELQPKTFYSLLKQLTATISVPFKGEPLMGLQIMGMLETRALDFEHLIIASFNDNIIPRKEHPQSIVPYNLRKIFGLPTYENNDAIYAYNFYRLLGRTKKITLIYDSRNDSNIGEISRFYYQLKFLHHQHIQSKSISYKINFTKSEPIIIKKEGVVIDELNQFLDPQSKHQLSCSALNTYIACPLKFYFSKIAKIDSTNEIEEDVDAKTFGTLYHNVMQEIYTPYQNQEITKELIDRIIANKATIDTIITNAFNDNYFKSDKRQQLQGYHLLVGRIIHKYVENTLRYDQKKTPFTYIASELKLNLCHIPLSDGKRNVYFKGFIDRIDEKNNIYNIIDYKTRKFDINYTDESTLFQMSAKQPKEVMQTIMYCLMYEQKNPGKKAKPGIYVVRNLHQNEWCDAIMRSKEEVTQYSMVKEEFEKELQTCLDNLFNFDLPFAQTDDIDSCTYCSFKNICSR